MYVVIELPNQDMPHPQAAGPFLTYADADAWAESEELASDWYVVELFDPEDMSPPF